MKIKAVSRPSVYKSSPNYGVEINGTDFFPCKDQDEAIKLANILKKHDKKISLTGDQILTLAQFANVNTAGENEVEYLETEITVDHFPEEGVFEEGKVIGKVIKEGAYVAYFTEYPEEGCIILPSENLDG